MEKVRKVGEFYRKIIMSNIGIFIFVGLLAVVFNDHGWFPNGDIYAISQLVYHVVLPVSVAASAGRTAGGEGGRLLAVLTLSGVLMKESSVGMLGAILLGPLAGFLWKQEQRLLEKCSVSGMQMLINNLCIGISGAVMGILGFCLVQPVLDVLADAVSGGMELLISHGMTGFLNILIEPAKVFFFNNIVNHAVLVPLGAEQAARTGSSVLFLLEANPGPGIGILSALYFVKKENRNEYASALAAQAFGGIHEVYFPFVLADLRLLVPLILGGMAGSFCFTVLGAGMKGVISPGSLIIILLMAGKDSVLPAAEGILISALVTFAVGVLILKRGKSGMEEKKIEETMAVPGRIERIAFVCDGGMGSSAMGAALFRRKMAAAGVSGIQAEAYASDLLPDGMDLIVCQRDFYQLRRNQLAGREVYLVENLVSTEEYGILLEKIQKRNGGEPWN